MTRVASCLAFAILALLLSLSTGCGQVKRPDGGSGLLPIGADAPEVIGRDAEQHEVRLSALRGKPVVVYFYPQDGTPGCTKEACAFRDAWSELAKTNVVLVGISTDSLDSHKQFAEHHKLPFHLISDPDGSIAKAYGVPNNAGFLGRQTFVVGADGNLKKIYRSVDVSKHASEVLADVKGSS